MALSIAESYAETDKHYLMSLSTDHHLVGAEQRKMAATHIHEDP